MKILSTMLLGSLLLAACNDPPQGPSPAPDFTIVPTRQWSGGDVVIRSSFFSGQAALPRVVVDSQVVATSRVDDTTLVLTLPTGSTGDLPVHVKSSGFSYSAGYISRVGYRGSQVLPVAFGPLTVQSFPQGPVIIGESDLTNIGVWSLGSGSLAVFPDFTTFQNVVGTSYRGPTYAVMYDKSLMLGEWQLWPTLTFVDTVRASSSARFATLVGPGADLLSYHHETVDGFAGTSRYFPLEEPSKALVSVIAHRAIVSGSNLFGVPVFDTGIGDSAFSLPLYRMNGAVFSLDGSRLFVVGSASQGGGYTQLEVVDAATGAPQATGSLPSGAQGYDLTLDLSETLLFVAGESDSLPIVLVYDAATLRLLGTLTVPPLTVNRCNNGVCFYSVIATDESRQTIYLAIPGTGGTVHEFDLLR